MMIAVVMRHEMGIFQHAQTTSSPTSIIIVYLCDFVARQAHVKVASATFAAFLRGSNF